MIVKANGEREVFDRSKLEASLKRSGATPEDVERVVARVEEDLRDGMTTREIYRDAFEILKEHNTSAANTYSLRDAILDLGPSGYPFEQFIAELFRHKGYEVSTGQWVEGKCVGHEVDVIACKGGENLIMLEAKFHNEHGTKSDVRDALYVKARFDDIEGGTFEFYGCSLLHEGWLVTNTKFSDAAMKYGECAGLTMLGWDYPRGAGLETWIEESGLHPVTCLSSLSGAQKRQILKQEVVLCKTIRDNPEVLAQAGISEYDQKAVLEEISKLA